MESLQLSPNPRRRQQQQQQLMISVSSKLRPIKLAQQLRPIKLAQQIRPLCTSSSSSIVQTPQIRKKAAILKAPKISEAQLKENWLASLSCPSPQTTTRHSNGSLNLDSGLVLGVDPDVSGALALLKFDPDSGSSSAEVYDCPHVQVLVSRRVRKRLDAKSIVQLLLSFDAPLGTPAYIEQSNPFPQDGKQGWWSGGFGYGMWIGILVALGFSVVPVTSMLWKNSFQLSGTKSCKDDSRRIASELFPSLSPMLKRKKDHGRAEALLIAAYGKGLKNEVRPVVNKS